jgi:hypothetical protein
VPAASTAAKESNPLPAVATPSVDRGRHLSEGAGRAVSPHHRAALLRRILGQGSPLIEAGLIDPDGLKAAVTELETAPTPRTRGRSWSR